MDERDLQRLGHLNFIEFCRESARWGEGAAVEESDGIMLFATGAWLPVLTNGAWRVDDAVPAPALVERADAWFGARGRGYTIQVRDSGEDDDLRAACEAAGITPFGDGGPQMVCRARLPDAPVPEGIELRTVASESDVADLVAVSSAAYATYGMPPDTAPAVFSRPASVLASPHVTSVVAYRDGTPVAAALTVASHGVAGVYWVGTVDDERGRGLGETVTRAVTNAGFDMGARANTLQASVMGEPIYRRMGYEPIYRYTAYVRFEVPAVG